MKLKQIVTQSNTELTTLVSDSRKSLATLAIDMRTKQVTGVKQIAGHKKTIARALTVLRQRELSPEGDK